MQIYEKYLKQCNNFKKIIYQMTEIWKTRNKLFEMQQPASSQRKLAYNSSLSDFIKYLF